MENELPLAVRASILHDADLMYTCIYNHIHNDMTAAYVTDITIYIHACMHVLLISVVLVLKQDNCLHACMTLSLRLYLQLQACIIHARNTIHE